MNSLEYINKEIESLQTEIEHLKNAIRLKPVYADTFYECERGKECQARLNVLEQIKQEWEKEGFKIVSCSKERFEVYKNWIEKGHHTYAEVAIDECLYIVGEFSNKYIQLLIKTIKVLRR